MCTGVQRGILGSLVVFSLIGGLLLWSRPARAVTESRRKAEVAFLEGVAAFKAGDLEAAAQHFERAMKMDRHPVLIYNLAVAFDKLGDKTKAVRYYKEYLKTSPPDEVIARLRLKQLDPAALDALDKEMEAARAVAAAIRAAQESPGGKDEGRGPEPVVPVAPGPGGGEGPLGRVRAYTWAVLGLGVISMGAGGAFAYLTRGAADDFNDARLRSEAEDAKSRAESHALLANLGFGVGAAALATGVALAITNMRSDEPAATMAQSGWVLQPMLGCSGGGLWLHHGF